MSRTAKCKEGRTPIVPKDQRCGMAAVPVLWIGNLRIVAGIREVSQDQLESRNDRNIHRDDMWTPNRFGSPKVNKEHGELLATSDSEELRIRVILSSCVSSGEAHGADASHRSSPAPIESAAGTSTFISFALSGKQSLGSITGIGSAISTLLQSGYTYFRSLILKIYESRQFASLTRKGFLP